MVKSEKVISLQFFILLLLFHQQDKLKLTMIESKLIVIIWLSSLLLPNRRLVGLSRNRYNHSIKIATHVFLQQFVDVCPQPFLHTGKGSKGVKGKS